MKRLYTLFLTLGLLLALSLTVELIKTAPFGDPMEVRLRGYELSLRKEDAAQIRVAPAAAKVPEKE